MLRVVGSALSIALVTGCASVVTKPVTDKPVCNQLLVDGWNNQRDRDHHFVSVRRGQADFLNCLIEEDILPSKKVSFSTTGDYKQKEAVWHIRMLEYYQLNNRDSSGKEFKYDGPRASTLRRINTATFGDSVSDIDRQTLISLVASDLDRYLRDEKYRLEFYKNLTEHPNPERRPTWDFTSFLSRRNWTSMGRSRDAPAPASDSMFCDIVEAIEEIEALTELSAYDRWDSAEDWKFCLGK